jgi:hypothetical protein
MGIFTFGGRFSNPRSPTDSPILIGQPAKANTIIATCHHTITLSCMTLFQQRLAPFRLKLDPQTGKLS